ncbi:hypothetical protein ABZX72_13985 [Streptomyces cyaneofuscatus]|uniref:hypothetical protein n=1 Tax=Streptomyces cyaneofuscatus TaxID=66883 RepID=UPI0033BAC152
MHGKHDHHEEESKGSTEQKPKDPPSRWRLGDVIKAASRIEPLIAFTVQVGSLIVTVISIWPGTPRG